uniref:Nucleolar complex protein 14 homolog n=1 Tax=Syphacia muris TaxID=451379 RepID=A0A0N5AMW5_9BILA
MGLDSLFIARKKVNPFELKFERAKHVVLGKTKSVKHVGTPGLARKRAFENRSATLGAELKQRGKDNKVLHIFLDFLIVILFIKIKLFLKFINSILTKSLEVSLTHKGANLTSVQKYERAVSDDDDDENDEISADVVSVAHFGGGKSNIEVHDGTKKGIKRKDMLSELIAKTKQQRFDKRLIRDELEDATERLDEKWKHLVQNGLMENLTMNVKGESSLPKPQVDDYDNLVLIEQKDQLLRLEKERLENLKVLVYFILLLDFFIDDAKQATLPFVFNMPENYSKLKDLLSDKTSNEMSTVIDRLVKLYHPSLNHENKKRLSKLLLYLIRRCFKKERIIVITCQYISPNIFYFLGTKNYFFISFQFNAEHGIKCVRALMKQQYTTFCKKGHQILSFRTIALVNLVQKLFSVNDIFHPVSTSTLAFALYLVTNIKVKCVADVAKVLLLTDILSGYVEESKRYLPEVIAFMRDVFLLTVEDHKQDCFISNNFSVSLSQKRMLLIENDVGLRLSSNILIANFSFPNTDYNRLSVIRVAAAILAKYVSIYSSYRTSFNAIFSPYLVIISKMPTIYYPKILREEILKLCAGIQQLQRRKEISLQMLEPRIDAHFDVEKRLRVPKTVEDAETQRRLLKRKVRKEMRGAMKELRKDNQFIARLVVFQSCYFPYCYVKFVTVNNIYFFTVISLRINIFIFCFVVRERRQFRWKTRLGNKKLDV